MRIATGCYLFKELVRRRRVNEYRRYKIRHQNWRSVNEESGVRLRFKVISLKVLLAHALNNWMHRNSSELSLSLKCQALVRYVFEHIEGRKPVDAEIDVPDHSNLNMRWQVVAQLRKRRTNGD